MEFETAFVFTHKLMQSMLFRNYFLILKKTNNGKEFFLIFPSLLS